MPSFYPENIPQEMKDIAQWVLWRLDKIIDKDTRETEKDLLTGEIKLTKVPYQPNGRKASTADPHTWSSFEAAFAAYDPSISAGLGFVFTEETGFVAVDFDHIPHDCASSTDGCTTEGWDVGVLAEISDFNSYTELSQSGEGAHVFCKGTIPTDGRKTDNHEMYCDKRFFAVTGNHINKTPVTLNEAQECITEYYKLWFEQSNTERKSLDNQSRPQSPEMSDEEVLLHFQKAANSEKFNKLHSGDIDGYHSNSEAQHAYCSLLAFYTQKREQIDRMLRASGLHDEKWDRRGKYTLDKVLNGLTEVYQKTESVRGRPQKDKSDKLEQIRVPFDVVGDKILKQFHIFNMRDTGQIYIYKNGVYKNEGADAILETHIRRVHDDIYTESWGVTNPTFELLHAPKATTHYINEVIAYIRSYTHRPRKEIDDAAGSYINLKNGLFNLSEWKFEEHDPRYLSISQSPVNYDEKATCPEISKFLTDVARPVDIDFLLEWVGYCLTIEVKHQKAVLVYGPPGTGKSVYLRLLEAIVGEESRTCQALQRLEGDKYRCARLYGKKVNICSDIPNTKMHESNIFKNLTSGIDTINGENKFQTDFDFRNTAKLIFSANNIPEGPKDDAYYDRWALIEFCNRFRGTVKEVKGIIDSLTTECELSGLLILALKGLKKLTDTGAFSYTKTGPEVEKEYLLNSNPSAAFMDECIVMSTEDLDGKVLYCAFVEWCRTHNTTLVSQIGFTRKISAMGHTYHRENVTRDGSKKVTMWDDISLRYEHFGQDDREIGQDEKNLSCPKISSHPTLVRQPKTVFGQDNISFVVNKNDNKSLNNENIESVNKSKMIYSENFSGKVKTSCPTERFFDSGEYGHEEKNILSASCPKHPNPLSPTENEESNCMEKLTPTELSRRDSKNYTRSEYNSVVVSEEEAAKWLEEGGY